MNNINKYSPGWPIRYVGLNINTTVHGLLPIWMIVHLSFEICSWLHAKSSYGKRRIALHPRAYDYFTPTSCVNAYRSCLLSSTIVSFPAQFVRLDSLRRKSPSSAAPEMPRNVTLGIERSKIVRFHWAWQRWQLRLSWAWKRRQLLSYSVFARFNVSLSQSHVCNSRDVHLKFKILHTLQVSLFKNRAYINTYWCHPLHHTNC